MIALSCTCKPRYVVFIIRNFYLFLYFTHRLESEISLVILIFFFLVLFFSRQIEGCNRWKWLLFSIWRGNHQNLGSIWINHYQGHCMSSWCWWKKLPSSEGKLYVDIPLKCHLNELTGDPRLLVLNICETLFINGVCLNWFRNNFPFESFSLLLVVLPSGISFNPLASNL